MNQIKESVRKILSIEIEDIYHIEIKNLDENLLSQNIGISVEDFLLLFEKLRLKYNIDIYPILAQNDSEVFSINNLAREIVSKYENSYIL